MDDSNILYYLVLGAIYIISRAFRKKKPINRPAQKDESINRPEPRFETKDSEVMPKAGKRPTSVEDILKELTKEFEPERQQPEFIEPEVIKPVQPVHEPDQQPNYQETQAELIDENDEIDTVSQKERQRDRPEYERAETFKITHEENDAVAEVYSLLESEHGARKAIILKEIFDRKY